MDYPFHGHGTTTLFAALDVATGQVLTRCKRRHRHQEYLDFLKHVDANVPQDRDIHSSFALSFDREGQVIYTWSNLTQFLNR